MKKISKKIETKNYEDKKNNRIKNGKRDGQGKSHSLTEENMWGNGRKIYLMEKALTTSNDRIMGDIKNGKPHGKGEFIFSSGNRCIGNWKNGEIIGQSKFLFSDGVKYVGELKIQISWWELDCSTDQNTLGD